VGGQLTKSGCAIGEAHVPGCVAGRQRNSARQVACSHWQPALLVDVLKSLQQRRARVRRSRKSKLRQTSDTECSRIAGRKPELRNSPTALL